MHLLCHGVLTTCLGKCTKCADLRASSVPRTPFLAAPVPGLCTQCSDFPPDTHLCSSQELEGKKGESKMPGTTAGRKSGQGPLTFASLTAGAPLLNGQRTVPGQHGALLSLASHLFVLDKKRQGTCGISLTRNPKPTAAAPSSYPAFNLARKLRDS